MPVRPIIRGGGAYYDAPVVAPQAVLPSAAAAVTILASQVGTTFLFDRASGVTYTLPPPKVGLWYGFIVSTSVTSNNHKLITDAATTFMQGSVWLGVAAGTGTAFWGDGATLRAVTQNGTTTGGLLNSYHTVLCISATVWQVDGTLEGSGTIATPFATS